MSQIVDERRVYLTNRYGKTEVSFFFMQEGEGTLKLLARFFSMIETKCIARWLELEFPQEVMPKVREALKSEKFAKLLWKVNGEHVDIVVRDRGIGLAITDSGKLYLVLRDTPYYLSTTEELDRDSFLWENGTLLTQS